MQADGAGATNNSGFVTACSNEMNDGTWFTFTGDGNDFTVSVNMPAGSSFDPQIGVYTGTCGSLVCEGAEDQGLEGEEETITFTTTVGTVYYVNVGDYSGFTDNLEGAFTINITNNNLGTSETVKSGKNIQVYPNPFTEVFHISNADKVTSASISDMSGRVVKIISNPGTAIHAGELAAGMYMVTLELKDGSRQTLKIIKK